MNIVNNLRKNEVILDKLVVGHTFIIDDDETVYLYLNKDSTCKAPKGKKVMAASLEDGVIEWFHGDTLVERVYGDFVMKATP